MWVYLFIVFITIIITINGIIICIYSFMSIYYDWSLRICAPEFTNLFLHKGRYAIPRKSYIC